MSKVSVIIPTYNYGRYLPDALGSVLGQTHSDLECIVVDDGSTDGTAEMVRQWQQRDGRVRYLYQSNQGPSAARNSGLKIARGDFIQFLDADDLLLPTKLEEQLAALGEDPTLGVSYCKTETIRGFDLHGPRSPYWGSSSFDDSNALYELLSRWAKSIAIASFCFLYRRQHIDGVYFDEALRVDEDWDWLLRLAARGIRFRYYDKVLALHRQHADSLTRNEVLWRRHRITVLHKLASTSGPWDEHGALIDQLRAEAHYHLGLTLCANGDRSEARSHFRLGTGAGTKRTALLSLAALSLSYVTPPPLAASLTRKCEHAWTAVRPRSSRHRILKAIASLGLWAAGPYASRHSPARERNSATQ